MSWISIVKPTGTPYTNVNSQGKEQYDDPLVIYDDADVFYDGINQTAWIDVSKPTGPEGYFDVMWSDMSMEWGDAGDSWGSAGGWVNIPKPI